MSGRSESNLPNTTTIRNALLPFGFSADEAFAENVRAYISLLLKWNEKVNLTTITSPAEMLSRHFGESLFALPYIPGGADSLLDVGSGAGFPGLVIKAARPQLDVTLMDPILKKVTFLKEAARTLGRIVRVEARRTEDGPLDVKFDCVTSRAVRMDPDRLLWANSALSAKGALLVWLGSEDASKLATSSLFSWRLVSIPKSQNRVLAVGQKQG